MEQFISCLFQVLVGQDCPAESNIVKKHHNNLDVDGDLSFPLDNRVWLRFMEHKQELDSRRIEELSIVSKDWVLPIQEVRTNEKDCILFLSRSQCFRKIFSESPILNRLPKSKDITVLIHPDDVPAETEVQSISEYRLELVCKIMNNFLATVVEEKSESADPPIEVCIAKSRKGKVGAQLNVSVGLALDGETKKQSTMSRSDYEEKRKIDMQLIAQHKYGLRVQNERYLIHLVDKLGRAAVIIDLVEGRLSQNTTLVGRNPAQHTPNRGAAFILYNSARIETLFRIYTERLESGFYPPNRQPLDWTLLTDENEWKLFLNYILEYPLVLKRIYVTFVERGDIQIHALVGFLYKLVATFSVYYRRTKLLTENRKHLMPVLYVRMYLLSHIRRILNECLHILDIEPVKQM